MTNSALMHRALEYRRLRSLVKAIELEAKAHSDAVVAELAKRGGFTPEEIEALASDDDDVSGPARRKLLETGPIEHSGLTVTPKASTRTKWAAKVLRPLLPRYVYGRVSATVIDNDLMKAEIKAGRVDLDIVAPARTETTGSPYIVVTGNAAA
jgi:hypothetical protein